MPSAPTGDWCFDGTKVRPGASLPLGPAPSYTGTVMRFSRLPVLSRTERFALKDIAMSNPNQLLRSLCAVLLAAVGAHTHAHEAVHAAAATDPVVHALMSKAMSNLPGKEVLMITVDYPPGGSDPVHRHDAHGFIYVLEGSIVMGVKGGKEQTLMPGDTFYEGPKDVHTIGRNASATTPARFLVFLVKEKNKPAVIPVKNP